MFAATTTGDAVWLQVAMLAAGYARAYGIPDNFGCTDALLAAEAPARQTGRGIWSNPAYRIRPAWRTRELMRLRGTYQLVEGRVKKAQRARGGRIYLNFGDDWRSDFSAMVDKRVSRAHPAWAASLLDLEGKRIRVRGWIIRRNGPMIDIEHPSQLNFLDRPAGQRPQSAAPPLTGGTRRNRN